MQIVNPPYVHVLSVFALGWIRDIRYNGEDSRAGSRPISSNVLYYLTSTLYRTSLCCQSRNQSIVQNRPLTLLNFTIIY